MQLPQTPTTDNEPDSQHIAQAKGGKSDIMIKEYTERQISATICIAKFVRRWRLTRSDKAGPRLYDDYNKVAEVLTAAAKGKGSSRQMIYALALRGPMPHVARYLTMLNERTKSGIVTMNSEMAQARGLDEAKALDAVEALGKRRNKARFLSIT
jgi:hypothetical protein